MFYYTFWFNFSWPIMTFFFTKTNFSKKAANINGEARFQHTVLKTLGSI